MANSDILIRLQEVYERRKKDEDFLLSKIKQTHGDSYIGLLIQTASFYAVYQTFIKNDFNQAKNYFSKACGVALYKNEKNGFQLKSSIYLACYAVISENQEIINQFEKKLKLESDDSFNHIFSTLLISTYNERRDTLGESFRSISNIKVPKNFEILIEALHSIYINNESEFQSHLKEIESSQGQRQELELYRDLLSFEGVAIAKLAQKNGFNFSLFSSFIPVGLINSEDYVQYEEYALP